MIRIFHHFDQMAMSHFLFGTRFCKIGRLAASVLVNFKVYHLYFSTNFVLCLMFTLIFLNI